jgi:DNA-binding transcriptional ArsR family regulator
VRSASGARTSIDGSVNAAFRALAEPRRRKILRLVWSMDMPAYHITARFDYITRSAVSQHLGVLRSAELIIESRDGTHLCTGPTTSRWKGFAASSMVGEPRAFCARGERSHAMTARRAASARTSNSMSARGTGQSRIRVGTPKRARPRLPASIEVIHRELELRDLTTYEGIPSATVAQAAFATRSWRPNRCTPSSVRQACPPHQGRGR